MPAPPRPLLVYDGECSFCRRWIARWQRITSDRVDYAPYQDVAERIPDIPRERFARAVQLIEPEGRRSEAAEAVFRSLACAPGHGLPLALYRHVTPFAASSEWFYRLVAEHRDAFDRLTTWIWGRHVVPPGESTTSAIFLRALGVIYAIAFVSLWTQILTLAGHDGILPAREYLTGVVDRYGFASYWYLPTLCWLDASDGMLIGLCAAGTTLSIALAFGFVPIATLAGAGILYLSLATACQDFLWFQWDGLLLETGFLAMFLAPWRLRSRLLTDPQPSRAALYLLRWLLFRLMFSSAVAKLTSGDPTWRNLTALTFHYETQPLPPWTAWYAHHLPAVFHRASAVGMFVIEGLVPFLILAPRRIRFAAAAAMAGLQFTIFVTGNYGFFNLLAGALCLLLLDDGVWPRSWRERASAIAAPRAGAWPGWIIRPAAIVLVALSLVPLFGALRWPSDWLGPIVSVHRLSGPYRVVNSYGLFTVMTTRRPEIIIEGSHDGVRWIAYEFRYKPGDPMRRPSFVEPHQPRVDWQMWFAALSQYQREAWFLWFCQRLLEDKSPVVRTLARNPFADRPPKYLRAVLYDYRFTTPAQKKATGAWWRREELGLYCPTLTLEQGRLAPVQ